MKLGHVILLSQTTDRKTVTNCLINSQTNFFYYTDRTVWLSLPSGCSSVYRAICELYDWPVLLLSDAPIHPQEAWFAQLGRAVNW